MRVVIDTDVAVSAAINERGPPADVIKAWRAGSFEWFTTSALIDELDRIMLSSRIQPYLSWDREDVVAFLATVRNSTQIVRTNVRINAVSADPDDDRVLEAAVAASADYVVSGDSHLLDLREYEGVRIVSPLRLLAMLAEQSGC